MGRKDNITEIDESKIQKSELVNVFNEMSLKPTDENEINVAINAIESAIEEDSRKELEKTEQNLEKLQKQKEQIDQINNNQPNFKEALIVAALMGNRMVRLNKDRSKLMTQISSPPAITFTTATNELRTSNHSLAKQKSHLSSHSQHTNADINTNMTDLEGVSSTSFNKSANLTKSNQANQKLNFATHTSYTNSKASKCMLKIYLFFNYSFPKKKINRIYFITIFNRILI